MDGTQKETVLQHLQTGETITSIQAVYDYGITRLAAVISKLKHDGWVIESVKECGYSRFGNRTTYTRYRLIGRKEKPRE